MRFVDESGRILKIYQQITQLTDEHLLALPWIEGEAPSLTAEEAILVSRSLLDHTLARPAPAAIAAQFHVDPFEVGGDLAVRAGRWLEGTLDDAVARGMPICSAEEWLRFTEARHDADLGSIRWDGQEKRLTFLVRAEAAPDIELTVMVPLEHGGFHLAELELDGRAVGAGRRKLGGVAYGWVSVPTGNHHVVAAYV